jgi:hypothetical protein
MLDPIVIPTLYFVAVMQLVLSAGVAYYAWRVTKQTGSFRAWTLIIAAFVILTVRNVASLLLTITLPADQVGALIESVGVFTTLLSSMINLAASVILFLGVFGLVKRFENQPKAP